jgi:hypothetical protein
MDSKIRIGVVYAASAPPERIAKLIDDLSDIEGAAGNLRGVLFELLCAYLVRRDAQSISMGVVASDPTTGKVADIDILNIPINARTAWPSNAKGKNPAARSR